MPAAEAAAALGVSRATLYAYVSRGYVRSQASAEATRERQYAREDVDRLRRRTEERRNPGTAAAHALQWGMPILESSITLIDGARVYYRGHDAIALSRERSVEEVASLVWTGRFDAAFAGTEQARAAPGRRADGALPFVAAARRALATAAAQDPMALDLRPEAVARCGWRILQLLTDVVAEPRVPGTVDGRLARAWGIRGAGADILRAALILCADHELNVSSFTARCVASAGSNPYAVVTAGLAALEGPRHGGAAARVAATLTSLRRASDLRAAVDARLRRGESLEGFGHPLYRAGDPRAAELLERLRRSYARSAELAFVTGVADAAAAVSGDAPNLDFALAATARVLRLPSGAPLTLFAIGRTIGWIGHAIEQYATGQLIRPRAKYVGVVPAAGKARDQERESGRRESR
jgi:citrate synthase